MSELHVIFGTGPLGKATARELVRLGKTVRMINRSGRADRLPPEVEIIASDACDSEKNAALTRGAAAVYQCARPKNYEWVEKFPPLQDAILNAAARSQARLVVADNLYMYGEFTGTLREDSPLAPTTRKGKTRAAMAQKVLDAHAAGRVRAAIGRASDFFGPDDFALTSYAILPGVQGKTVDLLGRTDQPHSFTYIPDFGRLLATLGTCEEGLGQVWFAPTNPPVTQAELIRLVEAQIGKPVRTRVGGTLMVRLLGLFNKELGEMAEMMYEWTRPFVIDTSKAARVLGLRPTPMEQAVRETVAWCQEIANR